MDVKDDEELSSDSDELFEAKTPLEKLLDHF
jgi:hypothetical protein